MRITTNKLKVVSSSVCFVSDFKMCSNIQQIPSKYPLFLRESLTAYLAALVRLCPAGIS